MFIGVELILVMSVLNKAGGAYGILSLLTGHPINFWQWLYNVSCLIILQFYIFGLSSLMEKFRNVRKMSLVCFIYTFDTFVGLLYTFYFIYFWFSHEDTNPTGNESGITPGSSSTSTNLAQSASPARELFLTFSSIIITTVVRIYCNLVIISFTRLLIKQYSSENVNIIDEEAQELYANRSWINKVKIYIYELEIRSKELLTDFFL